MKEKSSEIKHFDLLFCFFKSRCIKQAIIIALFLLFENFVAFFVFLCYDKRQL